MSTKKGTPASLALAVATPEDQQASVSDAKASALLEDLDAFFSKGRNTDRLRHFIEENEDMFALVASETEVHTNTEGSLRLYQLFKRYSALIDGIIEDFVDSKEGSNESMMRSLASAIQEEWKSPSTAYRCACTSYIAASMDYKDFLEFAEDMYGMTHYKMLMPDEGDNCKEEAHNLSDGAGYGSDDASFH
ncbi:hypothetical protein, conserved [Leishmania tarentolae]|uniref:Uncharacterized protein n=1 Tax=Leishmania tarentolae TaxID=5689 RepID=A0A640KUN6_LEITA|nr:hypothetical protein, conserved [Leishmania tarentolae]